MQTTHLTKGQDLESIKNSENWTVKKANNPIKRWSKGGKQYSTREDIHVSNEHTKRFSTLLAIREMRVKTTMK